jgi:hypothetical protein
MRFPDAGFVFSNKKMKSPVLPSGIVELFSLKPRFNLQACRQVCEITQSTAAYHASIKFHEKYVVENISILLWHDVCFF